MKAHLDTLCATLGWKVYQRMTNGGRGYNGPPTIGSYSGKACHWHVAFEEAA